MTLKELSQLYYLNREIEKDQERLRSLRSRLSNPGTANCDGMPKNLSGENRFERCITEIIDLESIIQDKVARCIREQYKLERYISSIPDSLTRQIFTLRFVNGLSRLQVAFSIGGGNTEQSVKMVCYRYIKNNKN